MEQALEVLAIELKTCHLLAVDLEYHNADVE